MIAVPGPRCRITPRVSLQERPRILFRLTVLPLGPRTIGRVLLCCCSHVRPTGPDAKTLLLVDRPAYEPSTRKAS